MSSSSPLPLAVSVSVMDPCSLLLCSSLSCVSGGILRFGTATRLWFLGSLICCLFGSLTFVHNLGNLHLISLISQSLGHTPIREQTHLTLCCSPPGTGGEHQPKLRYCQLKRAAAPSLPQTRFYSHYLSISWIAALPLIPGAC